MNGRKANFFDLYDSFSYPLFLGLKVVDLVKDPGVPRGLTTSTTLILYVADALQSYSSNLFIAKCMVNLCKLPKKGTRYCFF